ncbi:MAG: 23S rRNA (uracil(1939)-C(5))-methyltransferase RlmD [Cyanobacteria bacterium]|nr:23S rRNA (uracil(1939)-C(5))-methyltransferase RlmD [Cyanobacteriota bacterium]MDW8203051.1 23S rRNA (uracil(1939)-C(5))-methyltransferase RlmD [Cyanobacteriota bacterium SKYGB_h_bin112]
MSSTEFRWQQGELADVVITDLDDQGNGVGRVADRVVFVPETVPGDRVQVRLTRVKPQYGYGKVQTLRVPAADRVQPVCIVADKCGGCQWQHVAYDRQLGAKHNQVVQALQRIGGIPNPPVEPILSAASPLGYRNKATYPLGQRSSPTQSDVVVAGYYQKGSHKLVNLNRCPAQDDRLNPLLAEVKQDIQHRGWTIYDEACHRGQLRHLSLRIGRRTGELLLTLVSTEERLPGLTDQAEQWLQRYPNLVGVCLNHHPQRGNAVFGAVTNCVAGRGYLHERFAGLTLQIQPTTFFQVYTEQAEALLQTIVAQLALQGHELLVDAYCGIGTFTLPLARQVKWAIGLEAQPESIDQARLNAQLNSITNVTFQAGSVESLLPTIAEIPDIVLLDPPRKGCSPAVLDWLLTQQPDRIVYISCKPATLARDLQRLCVTNLYQLERVQPADFFPQTTHVECAAFLRRSTSR